MSPCQPAPRDAALRAAAADFRATFEQAPIGLAHIAPDGRWLLVNPKLCAILSYSVDEFAATSLDMLTHPDDRALLRGHWQQMVDGARPAFMIELRCLHKNGAARWISLRIARVDSVQRQPDYCIAAIEDIDQRKQADRALYHSDLRAHLLVNSAPQMMWMLDAAGNVGFLNQRFIQYTGYTLEQTAGGNWITIIHPDDRERVTLERSQGLADGVAFQFEVRLREHTGSYCWHLMQVLPLRDEQGTILGWSGTAVEIDARKRAEQGLSFLAEASSVLASTLDYEAIVRIIARLAVAHLGDWCMVHLVDGGVVQRVAVEHHDPANVALAQALQERYPPDFDAPHSLGDVLRSGKPDVVSEIPEALLAAWAHNAEHLARLRALGLVSLMIVPLLARTQTIGTITFVTAESGRRYDAIDLQQAQDLALHAALAIDNARLFRAAQAAQDRLSFLAEASSVLSASLDYEVTLQAVARLTVPHIADYCLIDMLEADGQVRRVAMVHGDPAKAAIVERAQHFPPQPHSPLYAVLATGQAEFVPQVTPDWLDRAALNAEHREHIAALNPTSLMVVPLLVENAAVGAISLVRAGAARPYLPADLELAQELARRAAHAIHNARLYHAAQEAVREREALFSIASHELKNPLTPIWSYAQILQRRLTLDAPPTERDLRAVQIIGDQAQRLTAMLDDLLDVSRLDQGRLAFDRKPVDVVALAERLIEQMQPALHENGLHTLLYHGPSTSLVVLGDALRLEQVVRNLINNAIKYSPAGGPVVVEITSRAEQVCVAVRDRGIGIPAAALPKLFARFYRATNAADQAIKGFGIGLYVVKEIVQQHGGTIDVASREGEGSVFTVCLPLHEYS